MISVCIGQDKQAPDFVFNPEQVVNISTDFAVDPIQNEMSADIAEITVVCVNDDINAIAWATPVWIYNDLNLVGKLYSIGVKRVGKQQYEFKATSAIGLLDYETYYGGYFEAADFSDVVKGIIQTNGISPTFDSMSESLYRGLYDNSDPSDWTPIRFTATADVFNIGDGYTTKFETSITIYGARLNGSWASAYASKTSCRLPLVGLCPHPDNNTSSMTSDQQNGQSSLCGIYMDVTRASTASDWPKFGEVVFVFGNNTRVSLGTPTEETTYTFSIDYPNRIVTINGTNYTLTAPSTTPSLKSGWRYYGGIFMKFSGSSAAMSVEPVFCETQCHYMRSYLNGQPWNFGGIYSDEAGNLRAKDIAVGPEYSDDVIPNAKIGDSVIDLWGKKPYHSEIMQNVTYGEGIAELKIYGWFPVCTKREALHQLLFSTGVSLIKDSDGQYLFTYLNKTSPKNIPEVEIYDSGSADQPEHVNQISITEHGFYKNTSADYNVVYESAVNPAVGYHIVEFTDGPCWALSNGNNTGIYGMGVVAYNCNAAFVFGSGILKARIYDHWTSIVTRTIADFPDGKSVSLEDLSTVTLQNSEAILDRIERYYNQAYLITNDICLSDESCGQYYGFKSPFGETVHGFLTRMQCFFSQIIKATCEFVCGYTPTGRGFTKYVVLTGSGTWEVPDEVFESDNPRIRVVLIGGGHGGDSGFAGETGPVTQKNSSSSAADGGAAGDPGEPGEVYQITIQNPAASYDFTAGSGGAGGAISQSHEVNNSGSPGGASTITDGTNTYSSAFGSIPENGVINFFTGEKYAGIFTQILWNEVTDVYDAHGVGGDGGYIRKTSEKVYYEAGKDCVLIPYGTSKKSTAYPAGKYGTPYVRNDAVYASGGMGGGGGAGSKGGDGTPGAYSGGTYRAGNGGKGGDATWIPPKASDYKETYYGYGGHGGGGGGAGGASGWVYNGSDVVLGTGGAGGYGGKGGAGGDGCILIYY